MNRLHIPLPRRLVPALLSICLGLTTFTSCEVMIDEPIDALLMKLNRDSVVVMLGDTLRLNMQFKPDTVTNVTAYWEVIDSTAVVFLLENGAVVPTQVGETDVRVVTANGYLQDTCHVTVIEDWRELYDTYPYDMFIYADVNVKGHHNDAKGLRIAAFIDDELRGYGEVHTDHGVTYTLFRIWHERPSSGTVTFRYYLPLEFATGELEDTIHFDGTTRGHLKDLIKIPNK